MPYAGDNDSLYYEDSGHGPAIVFIPGFGGVGSFWKRQVEFFSRSYRVIAIDQRGAGFSARTRKPYSIGQMTDDVRIVLDSAGIDIATLVGHSTGGAIAQTLAVESPTRVAALVLSSTWCTPGNYFRRVFEFRRSLLELGATDLFHKAGVFFRYPPDYAEVHDASFDGGGAVDVDITISRIDAILNADMSAISPRVAVPTLVLAARDDTLIPKYMSDQLAKRIPGADYIVLDRGGHFLPETRGDDYNGALAGFFRQRSVEAPSLTAQELAR
ncbi:alpha/beta hydrolase [Rhodopseudomonas sp. HC1]|uniref:alpha/beta fold hydrolase n=1 Tax=Rhodopseudomonas infernalis TaxID=2897386 RepID=UPI001EE7A979|nr:alpha/beta hydrolase [Rhodopseudomonas infernalis]MCG6205232.1 alpha/beta hydrolase [Rhodopseudomonas infernalis]